MNNKNRKSTWRHLVYSVMQSLSRSGTPSQSNRFTPYQIFDKALSSRAALITRSKLERRGIGKQCIQTIPCIPMVPVDKEMCPCSPPKGCKWIRSKDPIPKLIKPIAISNSSAEFTAEFVEWAQFKNKVSSRSFKKTDRYYTFLDVGTGSHIYMYNNKYLKNVAITGVFEDPTEAVTYQGCSKQTKEQKHLLCNPLDTNLYTDANLVDTICKLIFDYFAKTTPASTVDRHNDNQENAGGAVNPTV